MTSLYTPPHDGDQQEIETIKQLRNLIADTKNSQIQFTTSQGDSIPIPQKVTEVLRTVIDIMAQGKGISLVPVADEVTTTQAAEILNISRPYLMKLINNDQIPYHQVGTHKRILLKDLLEYKKSRDAKRQEGLQKLTELSQELGLYDYSYTETES